MDFIKIAIDELAEVGIVAVIANNSPNGSSDDVLYEIDDTELINVEAEVRCVNDVIAEDTELAVNPGIPDCDERKEGRTESGERIVVVGFAL